ncbi:hypothetical protein QL093DRAFT_2203521 [Fusarium oxysporum]|nr:hypothetical protein QL093DRAFT_2203521 [Fusarium oxysporum]
MSLRSAPLLLFRAVPPHCSSMLTQTPVVERFSHHSSGTLALGIFSVFSLADPGLSIVCVCLASNQLISNEAPAATLMIVKPTGRYSAHMRI